MVLERQTETIDFLASPATHGGAPVERIDTHAAVVFLSGGLDLEAETCRSVRLS